MLSTIEIFIQKGEDILKVLIYTDLHCSYNSSILPLFKDSKSKYTIRLDMILKTGKWISQIAKEENVDIIINGGDTFDNIIVKTEELECISEFFRNFQELKIPHYITVGNHEKVNDDFNAVEILSNYPEIKIIKEPTKINDKISILPHMDSKKVTNALLKTISNDILVSHIDIQGSCLRDSYILDFGVNPELLASHFKFVANGHLHTAEHLETTQNEVWNIGGVSSISFVDNQEYLPSLVILDTDTLTFKRIPNPHSILFRRFTIDSLKDLVKDLKELDKNYKYALTVKYTNYDIKADVQETLEKNKKVIAFKLVNAFVNKTKLNQDTSSLAANLDVTSKFIDFLNEHTDSLKYDAKEYLSIVKEE